MATKTLTKTTTSTRSTKTSSKTANKKEDTKKEVVEEKVIKREKKSFDQEDGILCRSITEGLLIVEGPKTSAPYRFVEYGSELEIEYRDLVAIVRQKYDYIKHPYFVILDEDFVNEFPQIRNLYATNYPLDDIRSILSKPTEEMVEIIKTLPSGAKESLKNMVATDVSLGRINEIDKLKALNSIYNIDFGIVSDVFGGE